MEYLSEYFKHQNLSLLAKNLLKTNRIKNNQILNQAIYSMDELRKAVTRKKFLMMKILIK